MGEHWVVVTRLLDASTAQVANATQHHVTKTPPHMEQLYFDTV